MQHREFCRDPLYRIAVALFIAYREGMFVLAANEFDVELLPAPEVLQGYKGQSHAEQGFGLRKHPEFLASSLFLKKPEKALKQV